jgi:hypothetical protein
MNQKTWTKQEWKRRGVRTKDDKKQNQKRRKVNKTLKEAKKLDKNAIKEKELKIKVQTHELLDFTLISNANSLVLYQFFKSLFTDSSYVKFVLYLPLFLLSVRLISPLRIDVSVGLCWICPNYLKRCCTSFSSTGATPCLSCMSSFWTQSLLVCHKFL